METLSDEHASEVCFMCAGNITKLTSIWLSSRTSGIQDKHSQEAIEMIERTIVFQSAFREMPLTEPIDETAGLQICRWVLFVPSL